MTYTWQTPQPEGPITTPLCKLVELVAESTNFRVRAGLAADAVRANEKLIDGADGWEKRIFYPFADLETLEVYPAAVLWTGGTEFTQDSGGHRNFLATSGNIALLLVDLCKYPEDRETSCRDFTNFAGNVFMDLAEAFGEDDNLTGTRIHSMRGPDRDIISLSQGQQDRWICWAEIAWGGS
jgi:hypothetical protein